MIGSANSYFKCVTAFAATALIAVAVSGCGGGGGGGPETGATMPPGDGDGMMPDDTQQRLQAAMQRAVDAEIAAYSSAARASIRCDAVQEACAAAGIAADQALLAEDARIAAEESTTVARAERAAAAAELAARNAANAAAEAIRIAGETTTQPPMQPQADVRWPEWIVSDVPAARNLQGGSVLTEADLNAAMEYILSTEGDIDGAGGIFDPYHHQVTMNNQNELADHPGAINDEERYDCASPFAGSTCGVLVEFLDSDEFFGKQYQPIMIDRNGIVIGQGRSGFTYAVGYFTPAHADYQRLSYWEASAHVFGLMANRYAGFGVGYLRDTGGFGRTSEDEEKSDETLWRAWSFTVNKEDLNLGDYDYNRDLSATYRGSMLGVTRTQSPAFVHGDATITVSDGGGPYDIDASFTNMADSNGNRLADLTLGTVQSAGLLGTTGNSFGNLDFEFDDLPRQSFTANLPAEGLQGSFLLNGAGDEDIIGTFYHSRMIGAFGAERQ